MKVKYGDLKAGDVFEDNNWPYVKTTEANQAVELPTGALVRFFNGSLVDESDLVLVHQAVLPAEMPDHLKGGLKHGKTDLQVAVEAELGVELCPVFFADAEQYARRKLEVANRSAGRKYGEDGYGDEYLVLLTADTVRELAFSAWCNQRNTEINERRMCGA